MNTLPVRKAVLHQHPASSSPASHLDWGFICRNASAFFLIYVEATEEDFAQGIDPVLEYAIELVNSQQ